VNVSFTNATLQEFLVNFGFKPSAIFHLCAVLPTAVSGFAWLRHLIWDMRKKTATQENG
jgi:hypothetical protein